MSIEANIIKNDLAPLIEELLPGGKRYKSVQSTLIRFTVNKENELKDVTPVGATSNLINSIYSNTEGLSSVLGSKLEYANIAMETGRKPGGKMPPPKALERWALQKFGSRKMAFALAKSIQKKGIKGKKLITKFMTKTENTDIPNFMKKIGDILTK